MGARRDASRDYLALMLGVSAEELARLASAALFGTIRCVEGPSKKLPWALDVQFATAESVASPIVDLLRTALVDEHLYYVLGVEFSGFADREGDVGRPTFAQFKEGVPHFITEGQFTLKSERYPGHVLQTEIDRSTPSLAKVKRKSRASKK